MGRYGVWGHCDECQTDTWVVRETPQLDDLDVDDEDTRYVCGGGCDPDDICDDQYDDTETRESAGESES